MKTLHKYLPFLLSFLFIFTAFSCGSDDDSTELINEWKIENDNAFNDLATNSEYEKQIPGSQTGEFYMKNLVKGEGERVYFTSRVEVYYKGTFIDGTLFDERQASDGDPYKVAVSSTASNSSYSSYVIQGWKDALQHMRVGDKWEVYLPYYLAYGDEDQGDIPAYSTLIFEIEVVNVINDY